MRGIDVLKQSKDPNELKRSVGQIMRSTYDNKFENPFNNVFENYEAREHRNPGIDYSNRDYLTGFEDPFKQDIEELRAQRQPWATKAIAGSGRIISKVATEFAKIPIVAGGIIGGAIGQTADLITGEDNTDFMSVAFDNAWIRSINNANEWINDEVLPVYVKKAVSEGNLWDNITSMDFYATEGADGLGYIFAMLAPGAALNRFKLGSKLFGTVGDLSGISKGMKFSDEALTNMQKMAKLGLPTNAKNFDLYSQTIANTIIEAGAESQQAGQEYEEENLWRTELTPDDPAYMSLEELNQNKSNIMANIFKGNAAILIGPNAIMSKMLWGGARNSTRGLKNFKFEGGAIKQIEKKGALQTTKEIVQEFGKAGLREGFWEEGMQSATSDFFSANPEAGFLSSIGEIPQAYVDMISSVEGQKAIYLGGLLGGGMQSITNFSQSKKERENTNKLISYANNSLENYWKTFEGDIYKKDENGEVIKDESGKPELDEKVAIERLQRLSQLEQLSDVYDQALADGHGELAAQLRNEATISFIADFLNNDALGIETLQQYLQTSPGVETMAQNEGVSKESIISDIMDMAKSLELANQTFDNFSDTLLDVKNDKATKEDKQTFFQGLRDKYFAIKARRHFVNNRLESLDNQLNNLIKEKGRTREQYDNNGRLAIELNNTDARIKSVNDKINNYKEAEKELTNIENDFWNKKAVQKEFDSKVNLWDKIRTEAEAKAQEVTEVMDKINNATTEEELDDISKTNTFADKVINDAIVKKRQELQAEKEAKKQAKTDEQQKQSEANEQANAKTQEAKEDLGDKIDGYNIGEEFSLTKAELLPYIDNLDQNEYTGIIESAENNTEDSVTIRIQETGEEITIPKKVSKPQPTNLEQEFGTEGSEDHDKNIPKDNENEENTSDSIAKTGTLVLSTNKKTGKKLFEDISDDYLNYEKDPRNKVGHTVHFEVNNKVFNNKNWNNALKGYQKILRGETLNQREIDFLINHLPINAVFSTSKELSKTPKSPISTLPSVKGKSQDIFDKSSKVLRTHLINHLVNGGKIEDFTTTIEGQYGGMLKVDLPDADNNVRKNNILDLYHFKGMSIKEKIAYIRKNIAIVDQQSNFEYLNGDKIPFINKKGQTKEKAKGDVYLMIPKANGVMFPLKLNIKRLDNNSQNDVIADIYEAVLKNEKLGKTSTLDELGNKELEQKIKDTFQEEKKLIGKPWNDITIGDILDFMIFDKSKSLKSRIGFLNAKNHNEFTYGDPSDGGMIINSAEEFNKVHFKNWLENNKRQHVRFKGKKKQDSKADMKSNDAYIQYLIENRALSTNAVVGENTPTFQGYTNIYLDSNNVNGKIQPSTNTSQNTSTPTGVASNVPSSAFGIKPTSTSTDVRVTTNSGNITIKENGKMFYDNGNEVTEDIVKNKALVKKEQKDGTLRRSEYNGSKYAVLSDDRIISLNETSAGKEVYKNGKARDIILENAKPKKINSLSEAVPTISNQKAEIERRRQEVERISKLPFAERISALKKAGIISSNITYNLGKRFPIILNIAGVKVAFYRSSEGTGGKQKGSWTPMFGFGQNKGNPWLIKGNIDTQVNTNYNSDAIQEYTDILNKTLNWDHNLDKGQVKNHPYFKEFQVAKNQQAFNEELYGVKDLGIINGETDVSGFINSKLQEINTKYDAEIANLENTEPATQSSQVKEVIPPKADLFFGYPNKDGSFNAKYQKGTYKEASSMFSGTSIGNNRYHLYVDKTRESSTFMAFQYPDKSIDPLFNGISSFIGAKTIQNIKPAIVELQGDKFVLIEKGELDYDNQGINEYKDSLNKVENNTNNNRNSQNNFVSSHEVPNTASNAAVTALKENTKVKDKIEVSDELIKELTKFIVIEKKAIKVGSEAWKVFNNKSNQEKFDILKDIADTWNYNIDNIITKCK